MRIWIGLILVGSVLAGCDDGAPTPPPGEVIFDRGVITPDEGIRDPDLGPDVDRGPMEGDGGPPTFAGCGPACARLEACDAPIEGCPARCRQAPEAARSAWIECVSGAECADAARCLLPTPSAADCATICTDLEDVCAGRLPRPDCRAECAGAIDGFRACHAELAEGVCDVRGFVACLGETVYAECAARCAPQVECTLTTPDACLEACLGPRPADPLEARRAEERAACQADAGADCVALAACGGGARPIPSQNDICQAWIGCDLDWQIPCEDVYLAGLDAGDGGDTLRCTLESLARECPFDAFFVVDECFSGQGGGGRCRDHCETMGLCGLYGAAEQAACQQACGRIFDVDFPDLDAYARLSPQWICLDAEDCETFAACIEQTSPEGACARHCDRLEACDLAPADCADDCDTYFGFSRHAAQRDCVDRAGPACGAVAACELAPGAPCDQWCDTVDACFGPADRLACVLDCDDATFQQPAQAWSIISCALSAQACFGDFGDHVVDNCWDDPRPGERCLGFCQARLGCRDAVDPDDLTACLQRCGAGLEGDDALRLAIASDCLDRTDFLDCPAVEACVPDVVEPDCPELCGTLEGCGIAVDDCPAACAADPLLRLRGVRADRCLAAAEACGDVRICLGLDVEIPAPPASIDAFCAAWNGCGFGAEFDCRELYDILEQEQPDAINCTLDGLEPCPFDLFEPVDRCWNGGGAASPACVAWCEADRVCSEAPVADCERVCEGDPFADPDRAARVALERGCGVALSCPDFAACRAASGPEAVCAAHCATLAACDPALDRAACEATCDRDFTRPRHVAWRACAGAADGCEAVAACAPDPLPPCAEACAREAACGQGDAARCLAECDDRAFRDPLEGARYTACVLAAADCGAAGDCRFGIPSDGELICVNYCLAVDDCDPASERPLHACLHACALGFGTAEGRAVEQASACLLDVGEQPGCRAVRDCIAPPALDCAADCADLDRCGIDLPDCLGACADAGLEQGGCLADVRRLSRGCAGVYACVGREPPPVDPACDALCTEVARCGDADALLCGIECTPADAAVPYQQACAEVARCAELPMCLALEAEPAAPCRVPCADAVDCGAFPDLPACTAVCTGRLRSGRAPADYIATLGPCLAEAGGDACDPEAARACFDVAANGCEAACAAFDACFGPDPDCVFFCEQDLQDFPEFIQADIDCAIEHLAGRCDVDGFFNCQDGF